MELVFKKLGNSTGLTFPVSFLREHGVAEGQVFIADADSDGTITLRPKVVRMRYTAAELNAQCDFKAPMPSDMIDSDNSPDVGSESL